MQQVAIYKTIDGKSGIMYNIIEKIHVAKRSDKVFERLRAAIKNTSNISESRLFNVATYLVLFTVSLVMTVLNIITVKGFLTICTAVFSALCLLNVGFSYINSFFASLAKVLFALEVLFMFTFFLVSGNPDGFSSIWIAMLPSLGLLFFGRKWGTLISAAMFLILTFFLWLPFGRTLLLYDYNDTFRMRFPVLFIAFFMLAFLLETLRLYAHNEMLRLQDYYRDLSVRDQLTKVYNRQGMYSLLESDEIYKNATNITVVMFDIDDYKSVNDRFGHHVGDVVLTKIAEIISSGLNGLVCRWGGEEFVVIFTDGFYSDKKLDRVRKNIEDYDFNAGDEIFHITASIGVSNNKSYGIEKIDSIINEADEALYRAKSNGKNTIVHY